MNYLQDVSELHNSYYMLRHGTSLANQQQLIISHPNDGISGYGLAEEGRAQVTRAVEQAQKQFALDQTTLIVASDFARARETAEIAARLIGASTVIFTPDLRERYFGSWDKHHTDNYVNVWSDDLHDPDHKLNDVESTTEVIARATAVIRNLENTHFDRKILLVSHGDTLQILQTAFERVTPSHHRSLPHFQTGEIRPLVLKPQPTAC
jgi:probable phosphoglycerate mutase